jgi:hypothetical protein
MALNCPNCGAEIPTANINIQNTLALCDRCGHVFDFVDSIPARKAKQRKVRQPERLVVREGEHRLELAYQRVFDLNEKVGLAVLSLLTIVLTFFSVMAARDPTAPPPVPILFAGLALTFAYIAAMSLVNTTRIVVDEEAVTVDRGPLRFPINENRRVDLDEVTDVFCEETETSKSRAAMDRYYRVCVRFDDDRRVALLKSLPEEYAFYIAQSLGECLPPAEEAPLVAPGDEFYDDSALDQDDLSAGAQSAAR